MASVPLVNAIDLSTNFDRAEIRLVVWFPGGHSRVSESSLICCINYSCNTCSLTSDCVGQSVYMGRYECFFTLLNQWVEGSIENKPD